MTISALSRDADAILPLRSGAVGVIDVPALKDRFPVVLVRRRDGYLGGAARALCRALGGRLG